MKTKTKQTVIINNNNKSMKTTILKHRPKTYAQYIYGILKKEESIFWEDEPVIGKQIEKEKEKEEERVIISFKENIENLLCLHEDMYSNPKNLIFSSK
jgi:hypothetical protein